MNSWLSMKNKLKVAYKKMLGAMYMYTGNGNQLEAISHTKYPVTVGQ